MNEIKLRKATVDDITAIRNLAWQVFPETYKGLISNEQIEYMMEWMYSVKSLRRQMLEDHHTYILAFNGEDLIGYVSVQPEQCETEPYIYHLQKLYVHPKMHELGVGKMLFQAAIDHVKEVCNNARCEIRLYVNRHNKALHFYEKMGMANIDKGDFDIGKGFTMNVFIMDLMVNNISIK